MWVFALLGVLILAYGFGRSNGGDDWGHRNAGWVWIPALILIALGVM
jgi:hypothetical protein